MDLRRFNKRLRTEKHSKTLFVTHASRMDIVLAFLAYANVHEGLWGEPFQAGLVLAGGGDIEDAEKAALSDMIKTQKRPILFSMRSTYVLAPVCELRAPELTERDF
jgi:hypothetical protein